MQSRVSNQEFWEKNPSQDRGESLDVAGTSINFSIINPTSECTTSGNL